MNSQNYSQIIQNLNIDEGLKTDLLGYKNDLLDPNSHTERLQIKKKFKINFIINTYTCYNLINDKRKGNTENEINVMCQLTKICDVYYNDVYINDLIDNNNYIKINKVNERLKKHKLDGNKYYEGYEIFIPTTKYDFIFFRGDKKEASMKLFKLLPEQSRIFSHNYDEDIWKNEVIGFQTSINSYLAKNKLLQKFEDDKTLSFKQDMVVPENTFLRFQFMKIINEFVQVDDLKEKLNSKFLIGAIGNINEYTSISNFIETFEELINKYRDTLNIKIVIIANEITESFDKYDYVHLIKNLPNSEYMSTVKQLDVLVNTWTIDQCIYGGCNKNLDCISLGIPVISPFSISFADQFGADYPLFYQNHDSRTLKTSLEKIITNQDNIVTNVKNRFENIKNNYNTNVLNSYYTQMMTLYKPKLALGYAFSGKNIGGVRKYIEKIEKLSSSQVSLFPDYEIDQAWKNSNYDTEHMRDMKKYIEENQQEIIDKHDVFHSNVDPTFIKLCEEAQNQGKLWVHTYHNIYMPKDEPTGKLLHWQEEINDVQFRIAGNADHCLCVGKWLVHKCTKRNIKSEFVPNFIDISRLKNISRNNFNRKYNLSNFILFAGDNSIRKNCKEFIQTASVLPDFTFVLIGTGLTKSEIESTHNIKLTKNVIALGPIPHQDCLEAMNDCRILVMNSFTEGLPTVLIETLYFKKPCIIPDGPDWSEGLLQNKEMGFKYPIGDINKLSEIIKTIMNNYTEIPKAKQYVIDTYSSDVIINKLDTIYKSKIKKRLLLDYHHHFYFIDELAKKMQVDFHVEVCKWDPQNEKGRLESIKDKDVIFCEWAVENAVWYSNNKLPYQKLIIRLHRWELFHIRFFNINWKNVDNVIFIAPEIERMAKRRLATYYSMEENCFEREYYVRNNAEFIEEKVEASNAWEHCNEHIRTTGQIPNFKLLDNKPEYGYYIDPKGYFILNHVKSLCNYFINHTSSFINYEMLGISLVRGVDIESKSKLIFNYVKSSMFLDVNKENETKFNLGIMGIIPKIKRVDIAIDIMHYLVGIDKRYKLYVLSSSIEDRPWLLKKQSEVQYYENVKQKIIDLNLSNNIIFEKFTDKPQIWMQKIGYLLSVSDIEGSHQAVAESMANGTIPFIYGKALKFYKLDKIYPKDYCFYEENINNLCEKINYYTNNDEVRLEVSDNCKVFAKNNFSIDHIYNQIRPLLLPIQNYSFYTTTNVSIA